MTLPTAVAFGTLTACIPASYAVATTPGAWYAQLYLFGSRIHIHVAFEGADFKAVVRRTMMNQVSQKLVAPGLVVPIEFAVGGNEDQLRFSSITFALGEVFGQVAGGEEISVAGCVPIKRYAA